MVKSIEPQPSTLGEKMATKLPTSKNEVKKVKFRFNFIVSDDDESDDGNSGAAHTSTVIAETAQADSPNTGEGDA